MLTDQQTLGSPSYHHWLTPQQVGDLYGPTQDDIDALTSWLTSHGMSVLEVAPSRVFVTVTGSSFAVSTALGTSFHSFDLNGALRRSIVVDPAIPTAFEPIIKSISGLSEDALLPLHRMRSLPMSANAGQKPTADAKPAFTNGASGPHFLSPGDFANIFDLNPAYSSLNRGAGQRVAIIGRSRVVTTDISEFETLTGITPQNLPNTIIPATGVDPGVTADGDQAEATLDVDRVIGTAPQVQADLVVSGSSGNFDGVYVAAQYEVQTLLDPVMTISFGSCETYSGPAGVTLWDTLFSQAASEGISVFVSAGDAGAAGCDTNFAMPPSYQFLSINYICSSSYATCVGGTEMADSYNGTQYWSATNSSSLVSALGYIPEGSWNEPATTGVPLSYVAASGAGGASIYVPKPSWQTGAGVPADNARDVPDVSFPAADHDGYFICYAQGGGDCAMNRFNVFSGTSAAAPAMAGVAALLNQRAGSPQGSLNTVLYSLAGGSPGAFHDVTPASSGVSSCTNTIPSMCNNSVPASYNLTGGLAGYALTAGYDQATGLGSLDVANFLSAAAKPPGSSQVASALSLHESASVISATETEIFTATLSPKVPGAPTGTVQFYANGNTLGAPLPLVGSVATTLPVPFAAAGSYYISATYSGDTAYAATTAPGIPLTVTGLTPIVTPTTPNAVVMAGGYTSLTVTVGSGTGTVTPTGLVRFYATDATSAYSGYIATVSLSRGTATAPLVNLPVGSYSVRAIYLGDDRYSTANSPAIPLAFTQAISSTSLIVSTNSVGVLGSKDFTVNIGFTSSAAPPTGTYQIYANGTPLGASFAITGTAAVSHVQSFAAAGTYSVTAAYSGDVNTAGSVSPAQTVVVSASPATYQATAASPTISLLAGASGGGFDDIVVTSINGYAGVVNFVCSVVYAGSGIPGDIPTCQVPSSMNVAPDGAAPQVEVGLLTTQAAKIKLTDADAQRPFQVERRTWLGGGALFCLIGICLLPRQRHAWRSLSTLLLCIGVCTLDGCGGAASSTGGSGTTGTTGTTVPVTGTVLGNYTITVTPTATIAGVANPAPVKITLTIHS